MFTRPALRILMLILALALATHFCHPASAQTFSFEGSSPFGGSPLVSGDTAHFAATTSHPLTGSQSLHFVDPGPGSFESFTYADPTAMAAGRITVWFYDRTGMPAVANPLDARWGMSIILEDADNPADFGAVEICNLAYGNAGYFASEGSGDRLKPGDRFYSGLPGPRSVGWHRVDFDVATTLTTIRVDGAAAQEVAAPGGEKRLRLRVMADSASVGGFDNWATTTSDASYPAQPGLVYVDDITFERADPTSQTARLDFEIAGSTPDYDTVGQYMGPDAHDNPAMRGFVNTFGVTTSATHSGAQAAVFAHGTPPLQSVAWDLSGLSAATTQTVTLHFFDAVGPDTAFDKIGGAIMLESDDDPADFIAVEVWNASYPYGGAVPNYYLVARPTPAGTSGFFSHYLGDRSIGWHTVEIILTAASSRIRVDGIENADGSGLVLGPGLASHPRLRIMADSPTLGGFNNWRDPSAWTDPASPELDTLYLVKDAPYLFFDDLVIPGQLNAAAHTWRDYR